MKKKYKFFLLSVIAVMIFSCEEGWFSPKPLSIFAPENVYVDKAGLDAVLLTCRRGLRDEFYGGPSVFTNELMSSECCISGSKGVTATHNFRIQVTPNGTGQSDFFKHWDNAYVQIRNANVIISRIDAPDWNSEQDKNEILAEAYFHRAYWYYRLVNQFGDVPFLNREYTEPKTTFYTHSRKTILTKIQDDMEFAVLWLPNIVDPGKVNRAAGNHLLTKIYLANSQFDKAISSASAVIESGVHSLMKQRFGKYASDGKYNVIWDLHQKENKSSAENKEGILIVQDKYGFPDAQAGNGTDAIRNYSGCWWNTQFLRDPEGKSACTDKSGDWQIVKLGRGNGYARPTNYTSYEIWADCGADLRHDTTVNWMPMEKLLINNPSSNYYGEPVEKKYNNTIDTIQSWFPWPYYKFYIEDEQRPLQPWGGHSDWYVFRLAETYLLRAEAYWWKGDLIAAASDINEVRARTLAPPVNPSNVTIEYILDERVRELYGEEPRKTELTRIAFIMANNSFNGYSTDNFHKKNYWFDRIDEKNNFYNFGIMYGTNEYKIDPYHVLWPIPQDVIDNNMGGFINQNIGYFGSENNISPKEEITESD